MKSRFSLVVAVVVASGISGGASAQGKTLKYAPPTNMQSWPQIDLGKTKEIATAEFSPARSKCLDSILTMSSQIRAGQAKGFAVGDDGTVVILGPTGQIALRCSSNSNFKIPEGYRYGNGSAAVDAAGDIYYALAGGQLTGQTWLARMSKGGSDVWHILTQSLLAQVPTLAVGSGKNGAVYVLGDRSVAQFDKNGNLKWVMQGLPGGNRAQANPIVTDNAGNAYVGGGKHLIKLDRDGKIIWQAESQMSIHEIGISPDGKSLFTMANGSASMPPRWGVAAVDASSGRNKWTEIWSTTRSPLSSLVTADKTTVYVGGGEQIVAADAATGKVKWAKRTPQGQNVTFEHLQVMPNGDVLAIINAGTGNRYRSVTRFKSNGTVALAAAAGDGPAPSTPGATTPAEQPSQQAEAGATQPSAEPTAEVNLSKREKAKQWFKDIANDSK
jgi:outer membrane protein assembly factor BamB